MTKFGLTAKRPLRPSENSLKHSMAAHEAECLAAGCDAFLTKPIDRHKLLATIERLRPSSG